MRLFFAGEIPEEHKKALAVVQERLKDAKADVKWVEPGNLHITLRFLGDVNPKRIPELKKLAEEVGRLYGSFELSIKNLGVFPTKGPPRVVWAGIEEGKKQLSMLAQAIASRVAKLNFKEEEHEFKAHVTFGRIKSLRGTPELLEVVMKNGVDLAPWYLDSIVLMESQTTKTGSIYKKVCVFPLGKRKEPQAIS